MRVQRWLPVKSLPLALRPLSAITEGAAFCFLFRGTARCRPSPSCFARSAFVHRLWSITWRRRPDNPTGALMALTGSLFFAEPLLAEADSSVAFTLAQVTANSWTITFAVMILGFPNGTITSRVDRADHRWLCPQPGRAPGDLVVLPPVPARAVECPADQRRRRRRRRDRHVPALVPDHRRRRVVVVVSVVRWLRAPPILRRLLLPMLAGALAFFVIAVQVDLRTGDDEPSLGSTRATQTASALALVAVPLAFVCGAAAGAVRARRDGRSGRRPPQRT